MKNLILGLAINYGITEVKNFVISLRKFNHVDDVVLFVGRNCSTEFKKFLESNNVKTCTYETFNCSDTRMNNARFFRYLEFLNDSEYNKILITDVRDVVFQGDPFNDLPEDFLYLFKEDPGIKIGDCEYNSFWMECAYQKNIATLVQDKNILCAGTILGSKNKILDLLIRITDDLLLIKKSNYQNYQSVNIDQAILNKIAYIDNIDATLKPNGNIVGTIGISVTHSNAKDIITINNLNLLSVNGNIPLIVHQYDRHQQLVDFFETMY